MVKVKSPISKQQKSSYVDPMRIRSEAPKPYVDPVKGNGDRFKLSAYTDPTKLRKSTPLPYKDPLRPDEGSAKSKRQPGPRPVNNQANKPQPQKYNPPPKKESPPQRRPEPPRQSKPPKPPPYKADRRETAPRPLRRRKPPTGNDYDDPLKKNRAYELNRPYDDPLQKEPIAVLGSTANNRNYMSYKDNPYQDPIPDKYGKPRRRRPVEKKYSVHEKPAAAKRPMTPVKSQRAKTPPSVFVAPVPIRRATPSVTKTFTHSSTQYLPAVLKTTNTQTDVPTYRTFATQSESKQTKTSSIQTAFSPPPALVPIVGTTESRPRKVPTKTISVQCDDVSRPTKTMVTQTSPYIFERPAPVVMPYEKSRSPEQRRQEQQQTTYQQPRRTPSPKVVPVVVAGGHEPQRGPSPKDSKTKSPPHDPQPQPPAYNSPQRSAPRYSPPAVMAAPIVSQAPSRQLTPPRSEVPEQQKQNSTTPTKIVPTEPRAVAQKEPETFAMPSPKKAASPFPYQSKNKLPPEIGMCIEAYDTVRVPGSSLGSIQRSLQLV